MSLQQQRRDNGTVGTNTAGNTAMPSVNSVATPSTAQLAVRAPQVSPLQTLAPLQGNVQQGNDVLVAREQSETSLSLSEKQFILYSHPIDVEIYAVTPNLKKVISEVMDIDVLPGTKFLPRVKKTANREFVFPSFARPDFTSGKFPLPELILKKCGKWQGDLAVSTYWWRVMYSEIVYKVNHDRNRIQSYMKDDIIEGEKYTFFVMSLFIFTYNAFF